MPEIHVSFFEPGTLELAMRQSGFRAQPLPTREGFDEIIKFKVLKNLRVQKRSRMTDLIPARPIAIAANARTRLRAHPIAWAA